MKVCELEPCHINSSFGVTVVFLLVMYTIILSRRTHSVDPPTMWTVYLKHASRKVKIEQLGDEEKRKKYMLASWSSRASCRSSWSWGSRVVGRRGLWLYTSVTCSNRWLRPLNKFSSPLHPAARKTNRLNKKAKKKEKMTKLGKNKIGMNAEPSRL